jgi:hypothetical protein
VAVIGGSVEVGGFGVDGAQAGVGELVVEVPLAASAEFGAEIFEVCSQRAILASALWMSVVKRSI